MKEKKLHNPQKQQEPARELVTESVIIICFSALAISVVMQFYLLVAVPNQLSGIFSMPLPQVHNLTALFGISYAFGLLVWGRIASMYKHRNILVFGLIALSACTFGLAVATQYEWLVSLRALQGFAAAAFPPTAILWLTENISPKRRVAAIACISCGFLTSASIGQWFGAAFIDISLRLPMIAAGAVYLGGALFLWMLPAKSGGQQDQKQSFVKDILGILKQHDVLKAYLLSIFLFNSLIVFYGSIAEQFYPALTAQGVHPEWLRTIALPCLMVSLLTPPCITRFGSLRMVWASSVLLAVGHALQLVSLVVPGQWIYGGHILYAVGIGFAVPSLISFVSLSVPLQLKGTAVSVYMFLLFLGGSLGSFLLSKLGVFPMITVQVCIFFFLSLWLGFHLIKRSKPTAQVAALAVFSVPLAGTNIAFAAQPTDITNKALKYYKELSAGEQKHYAALFVTSGKKVSGNVKSQDITLFRWQHEPELALGHDHVSVQVNNNGELSGLARMIPSAAAEPLPSEEVTEKTARAFLHQYAPDLLPVMNVQWIKPHRDETYTDGKTTYHINGMKMKCRSTGDGTYFWVIVGSDNSVIVFERDIEWDFVRAGRQTEKWLHDDWLVKNNISFSKQ